MHAKAKLFGIKCAKFHQNRTMFDKDIQKNNFGVFFETQCTAQLVMI